MTDELRVVGPPGTGKTAWVRAQVEAWVERGDFGREDIVLSSHTRAAAAELAGRVAVPAYHIATLHALAYRAIGAPPIAEVGNLAREWNKAHESTPSWQIGQRKHDIEDGLAPPEDFAQGELMQLYGLARSLQLLPTHPMVQQTARFAAEWEDFKYQTGSVDFTDMLIFGHGVAAPTQGAFVVDEAQDMSPLQWSLARTWGWNAASFIVAGDPAQVLYQFAGASPQELLDPLSPEQQRLLSQSHRLPRAVQEYAESWLRAHSGAMTDGRTYRSRDEEGEVRYSEASWKYPDSLLYELEQSLHDGRKAMVLASCSYMLSPLLAQLREAGIPYSNPWRRSNGAWNPLSQREDRVRTVDRVAAYLNGEPAAAWIDLVGASLFRTRTAKAMVKDYPDAVLEMLKPEHAKLYAQRSLELLTRAPLAATEKQVRFAVAVAARYGATMLTEEPRLFVGTIHSIKGGEADDVYVFPDLSVAGSDERESSTEGHDAAVRLGYVAMTRAREKLVLCSAASPRRALW